jgi:hypothetical protein
MTTPNAFTNYTPQLSWHDLNTGNQSRAGQVASSRMHSRLHLPGSATGKIPMTPVPSRDSINTETRTQAEKSAVIRRCKIGKPAASDAGDIGE